MTKKKNNKQRLVESLNEAINPKARVDRFAVTQNLLGNYRQPEHIPALDNLIIEEESFEPSKLKRKQEIPPTLPTGATLPTHVTRATLPTGATSKNLRPTAPERDFSKVANSIVRVAISDGWFIGKSKQIYDYIYSVTRGAIRPSRSIRLTKPELMKGSDCRAEKSLMRNITHLKQIGLLKVTIYNGERAGNEYEVFLPEEINLPTLPTLPTRATLPNLRSKVEQVATVESKVGRVVQMPENIGQEESLIHSLKTNTTDDEGFAEFIEKFQAVSKEMTGKKLSKRESQNLGKLADLLVLELKTAARRTDGVSSVPAFLTEVLRRQFFAARQSPSAVKPVRAKTDTVGKPIAGAYEIKPLDQPGREAALEQLREFADEEFLQDFKKWYTPEDWEYLIEALKK